MSYIEATKDLIIYGIKEVRYSCIEIIKSVNGEQLIEALHFLNSLTSAKARRDSITGLKGVEGRGPNLVIPPGSLKDDYLISLVAAGKSKNTVREYVKEIERFIDYLKLNMISLQNLNLNEVNNYLSKSRTIRGLSQNSFSKVTMILKSILSFLFKGKYVSDDISSDLKTPRKVNKETEFLSESDLKKVLYYLETRKENYRGEKTRDWIILNLGCKCGLRKSEVIKLNWENVNLEDSIIKILDSKGGKDRKVPFNGVLGKRLKEYRSLTDKYSGSVIRGAHGRRISGCAVQNIIKRIYSEAGIYRKGLVFHSLRHTYAVGLLNIGVNLFDIMNLLGHSSLDTTQKYLHTLGHDIKKHVLQ